MTNYHWKAVSTPPSGPVTVKVGKQRKDGKHLVTLCYQRTLRKLMTPEQVQEYRDDDGYRVIPA